jgi:hypothetical protein
MFPFLFVAILTCSEASQVIARVKADDRMNPSVRTEIIREIKLSTGKQCNGHHDLHGY